MPRSSIFNDVIGPIMIGPSSSHTAGPTRIGYLVGQLSNDTPKKIQITFSKNGSFAATYKGQKSDHGFTAGFMGMFPNDSRLSQSLAIAKEQNLNIEFNIEPILSDHPNTAFITITNNDGSIVTARGLSVGGGCVKIDQINKCEVSIVGDYHELVILFETDQKELFKKAAETISQELTNNGIAIHKVTSSENYRDKWNGVLIISTRKSIPESVLDFIKTNFQHTNVKTISPAMPILNSSESSVPFTTAKEMLFWCQKESAPIWKAALHYESQRGAVSEEEIFEKMQLVAKEMKESITKGLNSDFKMRGFLFPSAKNLYKNYQQNKFIKTGILDEATIMTIAVMELNAAMGCIVAAPTAGSCGVLPGALFSMAKHLGLRDNDEINFVAKYLLSAGIIGVFINEQSTFAAEVCGCQAECGSAASMCAAALVDAHTGNAEQACLAAAIAMQNSLGLICDPVAEQVEIPCISRNVSALGNAFTAANIAQFGFTGALDLDETIKAMWEVGNELPSSLRCTGKGGLCNTPSAKKIKKSITSCQ